MTIASWTLIGIGTWNSREQFEHVPLSRLTSAVGFSAAGSSTCTGCSSSFGKVIGSGNSMPEADGFELAFVCGSTVHRNRGNGLLGVVQARHQKQRCSSFAA